MRVDWAGKQRALERLQRALQQVMQVVFHGRDSTGSEQFERIDIECPANPSCLRQGFDGRQPLLEQSV